jgi:dTDP-4-amino-4,6-dideoxygalactose transaminase
VQPPEPIPFNRPSMVGRELDYIAQAVSGCHLGGNGPFTARCEAWLARELGAHRVLLTHSCTAALELAALLCCVSAGDEVILPSFTFVSTANAFVLRGARPVFVDIRPDTLNLDEDRVEDAITARTRVIVPVHYAGVGCAMDEIVALARSRGIRVVEDAAQGVGSTYRGRTLGTLGDLGCWSFHETKNLICGEGGALVVQDADLVARAEVLREKGTDRARFFRGEVDKYTWVDVGSSFLPSELIAAYLFAQLERSAEITARRRAVFSRYAEAFADLAAADLVRLPALPSACTHNGHLFYLLTRDSASRDALLAHLKARGVHAVFHYTPLHDSPMGRAFGYRARDMPVTEAVSSRLVRLPCFYELDEVRQERVIASVRTFFDR